MAARHSGHQSMYNFPVAHGRADGDGLAQGYGVIMLASSIATLLILLIFLSFPKAVRGRRRERRVSQGVISFESAGPGSGRLKPHPLYHNTRKEEKQ